MQRARGGHVAFLTQDAVPADEHWLSRLLAGFALAPDVGLAFGAYRPAAGASASVARELTAWFGSFSVGEPSGPRIDALEPDERTAPPSAFLGHRGFFTDANGAVARVAWQRVPFREIAYAEDHLLAQDMLRAGFAKVYVPDAAVVHSHEYSLWQWLRRSFDEARAMRDVYDWVAGPRVVARNFRGNVMADWRWVRGRAVTPRPLPGAGEPRCWPRRCRITVRAQPGSCSVVAPSDYRRLSSRGSRSKAARERSAPNRLQKALLRGSGVFSGTLSSMPTPAVGGERLPVVVARSVSKSFTRSRGAGAHAQGAGSASSASDPPQHLPGAQRHLLRGASRASSSGSPGATAAARAPC